MNRAGTRVAAILKAKGYNVTQVANPLTSLQDDVAATRAALAAQNGPTVLVAHSWGGVVIGEAGKDEKVKALVYVSAFAPDKGESLTKLLEAGAPSEGSKAIRPNEQGGLIFDPAAFPALFRRRRAQGRGRGDGGQAASLQSRQFRRGDRGSGVA